MVVNENIKLLRKYNGLGADQLAFALCMNEEDYFTLEESDNTPEEKKLEKIARIYNITMDQLFFGMDRFGKPFCESKQDSEEYFKDISNASFLSSLSKKEQNIIIAYRLCENKNEAYEKIRSVLSDSDK